MAGKRSSNQRYELHGDGVSTLAAGLSVLGLSESRRQFAITIVEEVLEANGALHLYWYKPPATEQLSCYWDDADRNLLWISPSAVHLINNATVRRPARAPTHQKADGEYIAWLLPGAESGSGGGPRNAEIAKVVCPVTFIQQPAGAECPNCEVIHG